MIEIDNVVAGYSAEIDILRGMSLQAQGSEIVTQIEKLALTLDASPWTPKEYQESHLAGLKVNLDELTK